VNVFWSSAGNGSADTVDGSFTIGVLTISHSTVNASGLGGGAGIGSGYCPMGNPTIRALPISNSTFVANGSRSGAGVGGGFAIRSGRSVLRQIALVDVNGTAKGDLAGIGCDYRGNDVGLLTISGPALSGVIRV
jgi:hypothetical protein